MASSNEAAIPMSSVILHNYGNRILTYSLRSFSLSWYPLPSLPPRGKESKTFPPWGKMKGGKSLEKST
jgi:hypothetical protein